MGTDILLFADTIDGTLDPLTIELVHFARKHSTFWPGKIKLVIPGADMADVIGVFSKKCGLEVVYLKTDKNLHRNTEIIGKELVDIISEEKPKTVCFLHTTRGCHLAASVAIEKEASCITAVQSIIRNKENVPVYERALFNGKLVVNVAPVKGMSVLTILAGAFSSSVEDITENDFQAKVDIRFVKHRMSNVETIDIKRAFDQEDNALSEADVIISAGRGIGNEDNLELVRELASIFPKSAVGGSKPVCDLKWLPYNRQVGATGRIVTPKLYIACGISGSQQHITGMKNAQWIVAINTDPHAVIFSYADYCIVEDLTIFIPIFIEKFRKQFRQTESPDDGIYI
ncbi:MAG: electron transfer flavoprotein subunit alpha/FixB family protein [Proteobacteria bacterium]|nr:electron transfer flavoprotein subunit alpha/FixB family protein [Pseudomonadota bacterium]